MAQQAATSGYAARGVWKAPHRIDGEPVAMAVDSMNRQVAVVVLHPGVDRDAVKRILTALLDLMDPIPKLQLVSEENNALANLDPTWIRTSSLSRDDLIALLSPRKDSRAG